MKINMIKLLQIFICHQSCSVDANKIASVHIRRGILAVNDIKQAHLDRYHLCSESTSLV